MTSVSARDRPLRRQLLWLTFGTLLPAFLFAILGAVLLAQREQSTFERGARERTLAILTAVDSELNSTLSTLNALASSRALDTDDLRAFYDEAARAFVTQPHWLTVSLALGSGEQLINVLRPFGTELPPLQERPSLEQVMRTGNPAVGGIVSGLVSRQATFPIRVPVKRQEKIRYVLTAAVKPESIYNLLRAQQLPAGWVGVVVDRDRRFVARTVAHETRVGELASKDLQAALAASPEGWLRGRTVEGTRVYTAHHTSSFSGWSAAIGVPGGVVEATAWNATQYVLAAMLGGIALAFFLAQWLGRRIAAPIGALAESARALARGELVPVPQAGDISEVAELGAALAEAGAAVRARIETQQQLATVTGNATVALFMTDASQLCTFMNPAAEHMTGYAFAKVRGRPLHDVVHRADGADAPHPLADCPLSHVFASDEPRQGQDVYVHRDGHRYDVAYAASPLRVSGVSIGAIVEVRDITVEKSIEVERRSLLEREQRARSDAEAANRAKDEFLAMLGHELRNPLAAIRNASHLLDQPAHAHSDQARDVIKRQSGHLARLVEDLLDAGRVASGKIVLAQGPVDLAQVVQRTFETLQASGRTARHHVTLALEPAWVLGDETRLEQIVTNLLTNALRYTPAGGCIGVALKPDGDDALLTVTDSGIGISSDMLPRVFDLFVQGERGLERAHGGLGIGLTLVKRLAELHGGTVHAASDGADRGCTFSVRLPGIKAPVAAVELATPESLNAESFRLLLVEDNADARAMMRAILELAGHEVIERADGPSGLEAALSLRPDSALIDIGLPGLSGYDVARRIRADLPGEPIRLIALTGYGQPQDRERALEAGFDAHLVKPVEPDSLLNAITASAPGAWRSR